jgi:hypothetical protein
MTYEFLGLHHFMTVLESKILESLLALEAAVKAMSTTQPKPNIQPLLARLDDLTRLLAKDADPNLLHYLHKKSYEKARIFLQGRDADNARGSCDRT